MTEFLNELYGQFEDSELSRSMDTRSNSASGIGQVMSGNIGSDVEQIPLNSPTNEQTMVVDQESIPVDQANALEQAQSFESDPEENEDERNWFGQDFVPNNDGGEKKESTGSLGKIKI